MSIRKILISGNFNILHPGHLRLFKFAKEQGDWLIVAVNSDQLAGKNAMVPESLRLDGVISNTLVDEAFILNSSIESLIENIKPNIVVKGKEYEGKSNLELRALNKYGGKLIFSSGESIFSTLDLLKSEFVVDAKNSMHFPQEYITRHDIKTIELKKIVDNFAKISVCVIGDLIVDEYINCDPLGMSQEDPTIVVTPVQSTKYLGGAGIVAAHAAGLGAKVHYITVSGRDEVSAFASDKLIQYGVNAKIFLDETRPTTLKQRFRCRGKTLLRVSHLHQEAISLAMQDDIFEKSKKVMQTSHLIIFSDFNYGCLPQALVERITEYAKRHGKILAADSQSSSQVGNIARFRGMDLITPTEREARVSARDYSSGLIILADKIQGMSEAKNIVLKMGEEGALIHAKNYNDGTKWQTDQIEALNNAAKDPAGAGDSMLTVMALSLVAGGDIWAGAYLGSIAAAIQVGRIGNIPITADEIKSEISN
jgi:rfaE bifunctional protein kinase chain/domain